MDFGVHLPIADLGQGVATGEELRSYTAAAEALGFVTVAANDHLVWRRPWLDGLTSLASVVGAAGSMAVATTIALPVVRHPVVLAKSLASLAMLATGPVIVGLGPGSSAADYRAVGLPFAQRWARFDEALRLVRALLRGEAVPAGVFYEVDELRLDPLPARPPQVWFGSWGSDTRLRRMADVADGWLASAYNTTPAGFADARTRLHGHLQDAGRDAAAFPHIIATAWLFITDDRAEAQALLHDVVAPLLDRDPDELAARLPIGTPEQCVELLDAYTAAGAQQLLLWPLRDAIRQLELFADQVRPHLARPST